MRPGIISSYTNTGMRKRQTIYVEERQESKDPIASPVYASLPAEISRFARCDLKNVGGYVAMCEHNPFGTSWAYVST